MAKPGQHDYGRDLENRVQFFAERAELLVVRHGHSARVLPGGRFVAQKSDLDFRVANRHGEVVFFDAKSFAGDHFTPSQITPHQVQTALLYQKFELRAGFLVELREVHAIAFFTGQAVDAARGKRLSAADGVQVGFAGRLNFRHLFRSKRVEQDCPPNDLSRGP